MEEFATRPWQRYGKDRTYVVDVATGVQVGYRDNATGALVPTDASTARVLSRWGELAGATAAPVHSPTTGPPSGSGPRHPQAGHHDATYTPADEDLSLRAAGHAARVRADEELAARRADVGRFRTWLGRVLDVRTDERAWRVGAAAEESIGAELDTLTRHGWRVLHSVPVGAGESDIDHVLIGPPGVLTVNSKHHPGANVWVVPRQLRVNNQPQPYLRNARHEAARASRLLSDAAGTSVRVTGVLVFRLGSGSLTVRERPEDVLVYRATRAARQLRALPPVLSEREIAAVHDAARWRSTWQPR